MIYAIINGSNFKNKPALCEFALQIDNTASNQSCVVQTQFAPHGVR
jgi:hypothetical protein